MRKLKLMCIGAALAMAVSTVPNFSFLGVNVQGTMIEASAASKTVTLNSKSSTTLKKALSSAKKGDVIIIDGTIKSQDVKVPAGVTIQGKNNAKIDFSSTKKGKRGLTISTNGSTIKDIEICNAKDNGIYITGNNNTLTNLNVHNNGDSGVQLSDGAANNTLNNVYSHHNADKENGGENADGFAIKLHSGEGNVLNNCSAEYNSDDGYDCYATHGAITFNRCKANYNGNCNGIKGDGNGFKLGGVDNKTSGVKAHLDPNNHVLVKCSAVGNTASGFDRNNQNGVVTMKYCVASKNGKYNYNWPATGKPSALGYTVKFGTAQIIGCSSSNGKNNISGAKLSGNCKGF